MSTREETDTDQFDDPPTVPCSVVWSRGHAFVLEGFHGRSRWVGMDDRGRPEALTNTDLRHRGWSRTRRAS